MGSVGDSYRNTWRRTSSPRWKSNWSTTTP